MEPIAAFFLALLAIILIVTIALGVRIVYQHEKGLIERFGSLSYQVDSGLKIIIPFVDNLVKVDMREQVIDIPPQEVITKDNVVVTVDAVVYLEVTDAVPFRYNVANFWAAVTKLAQTNLRNVVGDMSLDESLISRDVINTQLRTVLDEVTDKWGTKVTRVEIKRIDPPRDVTEAMHKQMKAERHRRAAILEAEAEKKSAILVAEGQKEAEIQRAEGEAAAIRRVAEAEKFKRLTVAEGEAIAIKTVYDAIHEGRPTQDLIAIKYLESLKDISNGTATKVFLPLETTGILGSLGGIGELFENQPDKKE